jgi:hypothetical protein
MTARRIGYGGERQEEPKNRPEGRPLHNEERGGHDVSCPYGKASGMTARRRAARLRRRALQGQEDPKNRPEGRPLQKKEQSGAKKESGGGGVEGLAFG